MTGAPEGPRPTTYWDYIRVRELLALQGGLAGDDKQLAQDEVLFITVHQVYELWFKLALRDLEEARDLFQRDPVPDDALSDACRKLERLRIIFSLAVDHFPLIETLTTRDFLEFRDKLFPANGGQSPQFREIEILLGLRDEQRIPYVTGGSYEDVLRDDTPASYALKRVASRKASGATFLSVLDAWLHRTPIDGSSPRDPDDAAAVDGFLARYQAAHRAFLTATAEHAARLAGGGAAREQLLRRYDEEHADTLRFLAAEDAPADDRPRRRRIRAAILFIESYRELPLLAWPRQVLDSLVALEQTMVHYRQRHARMAERIIGNRVGTGGSSGVAYLDNVALAYRVFSDLWGARTILVPRDALGPPRNATYYGFKSGAS
jgi:tryptophan 2,3-dioxygenase